MRGFRVAREAPTWRHVATTLLQTSVFWTLFLVLVPALLVAVQGGSRCCCRPGQLASRSRRNATSSGHNAAKSVSSPP